MVKSVIVIVMETIREEVRDKLMIDIEFDFDKRKFEKEIQRGIEREVLFESKKILSDLIRKGLSVQVSRGQLVLNGSDELLAEAKNRLK